jgi:hypothetical protein
LEEVAKTRDFKAPRDDKTAVGFANGGVVGFGLVVLVGDVADDGFEEVFDGDEAGDAAVLVDDDAHVLFLALHLAEELVDFLVSGTKAAGRWSWRRCFWAASVSRTWRRSWAKAMPVMLSSEPE